ncbi:hypothetical protein RB595_004227 [Gaeumannomyces hyphopodioides]
MYSPLDETPRQIRLLRLYPGSPDDSIEVEIYISSLEESPIYEALSYVWSDPSEDPSNEPAEIHIRGTGKWTVTPNLRGALTTLRHQITEPRTLWVDALCIDQSNKNERSSQVRIMRGIYAQASRVVVWLGSGRDGPKVREAVELFTGEADDVHWSDARVHGHTIGALFLLHVHRWWLRIWTLQEAVLARRVVFVQDGLEIEGDLMRRLREKCNRHHANGCCYTTAEADDGPAGRSSNEEIHGHMSLHFEKLGAVVEMQRQMEDPRRSAELDLPTVASRSRGRDATDPRDKVYGVLGLCAGVSTDWVDYNLSVEETYITAARESIRLSGMLDILSHAFPETGHNPDGERHFPPADERVPSQVSVPTWVPDWSRKYLQVQNLLVVWDYVHPIQRSWAACGKHLAQIDIVPKGAPVPRALAVSGLVFDTVERIGEPRIWWHQSDEKIFVAWRKLSEVDRDPLASYPAGGSVLDAYWRTLCLDKSHEGADEDRTFQDASGERDAFCHNEWWFKQMLAARDLPDPRGSEGPSYRQTMYDQHIRNRTVGRAFFVSAKGYFGLAPAGAVSGDRIYVLAGGRPAYVLRPSQAPAPQGDSGSAPAMTLVGECYVQGIMRGEAVREVDEGTRRFEQMVLL